MFALVVFTAVVATVLAGEQHVAVTQDTLGNYNLKYAIDGISRVEHGDHFGNVNGGFSYIDPHGILRKTEFTSGVHGYNAIGTDIPVPVQDTPEVAHAKAKHLSVLHAESLKPKILEFQGPEEHFLAPIAPIAPIARFEHLLPAPIAHQIAPVAPIARFEQLLPEPVAHQVAPFAPIARFEHPISAPIAHQVAPIARFEQFAPAPVHFSAPHHIPALPTFPHLGISETPEVLAARAEHFAAHAAAKNHLLL